MILYSLNLDRVIDFNCFLYEMCYNNYCRFYKIHTNLFTYCINVLNIKNVQIVNFQKL